MSVLRPTLHVYSSLVALLLLSFANIITGTPLPQAPDQNQGTPPGEGDPYSVTINDSPTKDNGTAPVLIPATATIYNGVAGGKSCRGDVMHVVQLPSPAMNQTTEMCYDLAKASGCGVFTANREDGCEAKLFSEAGCRMFNNVVVFVPEMQVTGGNWRSMSIRCGIEPPDEASLGQPPFADMIKNQSPKQGAAKLDGGGA